MPQTLPLLQLTWKVSTVLNSAYKSPSSQSVSEVHADKLSVCQVMLRSGETCLVELGEITNRQQNGWLRLVQMCHWQQEQLGKYQVQLQ